MGRTRKRSPKSGRRTVPVSQFKAHCLRMLDDLEREGGKLVITRRGKPLAVVSPAPKESSYGRLRGVLEVVGDIVHEGSGDWSALQG